ncbi:N-acetyltransferase [Arthrobacter frigidicola]|nr:N-acetyltransferase [Arthrobacter frigidicola]
MPCGRTASPSSDFSPLLPREVSGGRPPDRRRRGGPFLNGHLGYWVDSELTGRGIGSAAVAFAVEAAQDVLGLHRLQAATLPHNSASQRVLDRAGFEEIGVARAYLRIAGRWQDHRLYQRILEPSGAATARE